MMIFFLVFAHVFGMYNNEFHQFKLQFEKSYDAFEEKLRFEIFVQNMKRARELNAIEGSAVFGMTKFADLTEREFQNLYLRGFQPGKRNQDDDKGKVLVPPNVEFPDSIDWNAKGAVTRVKDQNNCHSGCWAVSTAEELESRWFMMNHTLVDLSVQEIVSCDTEDGGCLGGDTRSAFEWLISRNQGVSSEAQYPFISNRTGKSETCKANLPAFTDKITDYFFATPTCYWACDDQDEDTLLRNVAAVGPVSVCINADSWQLYTGGILSAKTCGPHQWNYLNHCVQLTGYGNNGDGRYWILRNSWNTDWGLDGFIHLSYGENTCGVANEATVVNFPPLFDNFTKV